MTMPGGVLESACRRTMPPSPVTLIGREKAKVHALAFSILNIAYLKNLANTIIGVSLAPQLPPVVCWLNNGNAPRKGALHPRRSFGRLLVW